MQTKYHIRERDGGAKHFIYGRPRMKRAKQRGATVLARWEHSAWEQVQK